MFGARVANQAAQQGQQGAQAQQAQQVNSQALTVEVAASVASISDKKAAAAVQCTILRGANEVGLGTLLDAGETVRLRLVPVESGRVVVWEGAKIFVSAEVEKGKAFDTPPLAFLGSGARTLRVFFSRVPGELPVVVPVTITYK